ncbi:hypothetical protein HU765_05125 [Pseudomonas sp. SWRI81]|uniref:hypothetical protein n=1 Tax=Pseudomonas sp. SWRI81 TaxID=2745505 RepID=UPI0016457377|nr:hypothetical protein [Pseudomonas sp. SWRI81]MBC3269296.1 hypothetical protein [Pseudomonas sp. SWRI81]
MTDETFITEATSPYESPNSKKFHDAAERALDHHFKPPTEPHPKRETGLEPCRSSAKSQAMTALSRMADGVRLMVEGTLDHIEVKSAAAKP